MSTTETVNNAWLTRITERIYRRIPDLNTVETNLHLNDLIETALRQIVVFANANSYSTEWDYLLVECVIRLYNYEGMEGTIERKANGVNDVYESSDILSPYLSKHIVQYIRPCGYVYNANRFELPKL